MNPAISEFMNHFPMEGVTFDDVSLVTQYADFLPEETDITSRLTSRINVNMPFLSAAMDTVTEHEMAIQMALLGGLGVIHKNMSIKEQVKQAAIVKHHLHGLIMDPIIFRAKDTIASMLAKKEEKGFTFSGFPILDDNDDLVGILTAADIKFVADGNMKVREVMTEKVVTAPPETDLKQAYEIMIKNKIGKLPLVRKGKLIGLYSFTDVKTLVENVQPLYNRDSNYRLRVGAAVSSKDFERIEALAETHTDVLVVDSAHGHSKGIIETVKWVASNYPNMDIVAGNVGTAEGAAALRDAGAHAVKVGIGPGSICTTRVVCGVGIPQLTAIYESRRGAGPDIPVIADGGIRNSGDVPKALAAGADSVMLGSVLAGTEESPGEKIIHQGRQYVVYRGMGSLGAMKEGQGSRERYEQAHIKKDDDLVPQGVEGIVPFSGTVAKVMTQFCGGLRASLGYCGSKSISEFQRKARFVKITLVGVQEGHPHGVKIMKEAPNYRS